MRYMSFAAAVAALSSYPSTAQTLAPIAAAPLAVAPAPSTMLRTGTEIQLKLEEPLTTEGKRLRVGQHFQLSVLEPVKVGEHVVIPVGAPATGEITEVRNKGMWGKSGHLTASLLFVSVNGRQIRLTGTFDDKGVTGTAGVVAAIAFVPVVGFFTTGTSARVAPGAQIKGFVGEDIPLVFAQPIAVTPLAVPAAASRPVGLPAAAPQLPSKPVSSTSLAAPTHH